MTFLLPPGIKGLSLFYANSNPACGMSKEREPPRMVPIVKAEKAFVGQLFHETIRHFQKIWTSKFT